MGGLFLLGFRRFLRLVALGLLPPRGTFARRSARRLAVMLLFLPALGAVQAIHWLGFLLDELLFPGYRRVVVERPLFILGVPRSGTTFLHHTLAADTRLTTFSAWECLFGLSVTARKTVALAARLDRAVGRPLGRLVGALERRLLARLDDVHPMSLSSPEEDYLSLLPIAACFLLVVPFPSADWIWRMAAFDRDVPPRERRRVLAFYRACLQKHLYAHGGGRTLLSKNAAFASWAGSLREVFPDARFVVCLRDPIEVVPSQLSSLEPGMAIFDNHRRSSMLAARMLRILRFYYRHLLERLGDDPQSRLVRLPELAADLEGTVRALYRDLGLEPSAELCAHLRRTSERARSYRSSHRYDLAAWGLTEESVRRDFGPVWERYPFGAEPRP